jgi:rhamnose utilization protein RhaD (predicted bifunctional aldolase and dehydrogenase)
MTILNNLIEFSKEVGANQLLVQGAGGNLSWKDGDVLWIKASGRWLADAGKEEIFVPVDMKHLREAINDGNFDVMPCIMTITSLKPSIETLLHALLPQPVVVHLHPVDILALLVRKNAFELIQQTFRDKDDWVWVPYFKPGAALAKEAFTSLKNRPDASILFLQNHGIVLGGNTIEDIEILLKRIVDSCKLEPPEKNHQYVALPLPFPHDALKGYSLLADPEVHELVLNTRLYEHLTQNWVLYPDHAVFLGPQAVCYDDIRSLLPDLQGLKERAIRLFFVCGAGVYVAADFSISEYAQLRCYYEILRRLPMRAQLKSLTPNEIGQLLDWEPEKYRLNLAKGAVFDAL